MARMKFLCDSERCIGATAALLLVKRTRTAVGVNRRRVVTVNNGVPGEKSVLFPVCTVLMRLVWQSARPIASTRPKKVLYCITRTLVSAVATASLPARSVRHNSRMAPLPLVIAARWTNAPSVPVALRKMDRRLSLKYGRNRISEGKLPACAEMCSTKALLAGDAPVISDIFRDRALRRGKAGDAAWGWTTAYGKPEAAAPTSEEAKNEKSHFLACRSIRSVRL